MAVIDFSQDVSGGGVMLPSASYKMRVMGWQKGHSKNKGTPQLEVRLVVTEGPYEGVTFIDRMPMTDASAWRVVKFVARCGVDATQVKTETSSPLFEKVLNTTINRKIILILEAQAEYSNNKVLDYSRDESQPEIVFTQADDAPAFLKEPAPPQQPQAVDWS